MSGEKKTVRKKKINYSFTSEDGFFFVSIGTFYTYCVINSTLNFILSWFLCVATVDNSILKQRKKEKLEKVMDIFSSGIKKGILPKLHVT